MDAEPDSIPFERAHSEDELELFGPFRRLVRLRVLGPEGQVVSYYVPEAVSVLRACQYMEMYARTVRLPWRDYCWNDTQGCCELRYRRGGQEQSGRACRLPVSPELELLSLPKGGRFCRPR